MRKHFKAGNTFPAVLRDTHMSDCDDAGRTVELKNRPVHGASRHVGCETQTQHVFYPVVLDNIE